MHEGVVGCLLTYVLSCCCLLPGQSIPRCLARPDEPSDEDCEIVAMVASSRPIDMWAILGAKPDLTLSDDDS
eukprot:3844786-Alexandrium_andersonii.AAC.1